MAGVRPGSAGSAGSAEQGGGGARAVAFADGGASPRSPPPAPLGYEDERVSVASPRTGGRLSQRIRLPNASSRVTKAGMLAVFTQAHFMFVPSWSRQYFHLIENCLYGYKSRNKLELITVIPLQGASIIEETDATTADQAKQFGYRFRVTAEASGEQFFLAASTYHQLQDWVSAMRQCIIGRSRTAEDNSVRQITLRDVLWDDTYSKLFLEFLESEFSAENWHFWTAVEVYRHAPVSQRRKLGAAILRKFLDDDAADVVSLSGPILRELRSIIVTNDLAPDVFDRAQREIFRLMEKDSFNRFKRSPQGEMVTLAVRSRDGVLLQEFLYKQDRKTNQAWKTVAGSRWLKRWCVLGLHSLVYSRKKDALDDNQAACNELTFEDVSSVVDMSSTVMRGSKPHQFLIVQRDGAQFAFATPTDESKRRWMTLLHTAVRVHAQLNRVNPLAEVIAEAEGDGPNQTPGQAGSLWKARHAVGATTQPPAEDVHSPLVEQEANCSSPSRGLRGARTVSPGGGGEASVVSEAPSSEEQPSPYIVDAETIQPIADCAEAMQEIWGDITDHFCTRLMKHLSTPSKHRMRRIAAATVGPKHKRKAKKKGSARRGSTSADQGIPHTVSMVASFAVADASSVVRAMQLLKQDAIEEEEYQLAGRVKMIMTRVEVRAKEMLEAETRSDLHWRTLRKFLHKEKWIRLNLYSKEHAESREMIMAVCDSLLRLLATHVQRTPASQEAAEQALMHACANNQVETCCVCHTALAAPILDEDGAPVCDAQGTPKPVQLVRTPTRAVLVGTAPVPTPSLANTLVPSGDDTGAGGAKPTAEEELAEKEVATLAEELAHLHCLRCKMCNAPAWSERDKTVHFVGMDPYCLNCLSTALHQPAPPTAVRLVAPPHTAPDIGDTEVASPDFNRSTLVARQFNDDVDQPPEPVTSPAGATSTLSAQTRKASTDVRSVPLESMSGEAADAAGEGSGEGDDVVARPRAGTEPDSAALQMSMRVSLADMDDEDMLAEFRAEDAAERLTKIGEHEAAVGSGDRDGAAGGAASPTSRQSVRKQDLDAARERADHDAQERQSLEEQARRAQDLAGFSPTRERRSSQGRVPTGLAGTHQKRLSEGRLQEVRLSQTGGDPLAEPVDMGDDDDAEAVDGDSLEDEEDEEEEEEEEDEANCAACGALVDEMTCITAMGAVWCADHFACEACGTIIDMGMAFYPREGRPYCGSCYHDQFLPRCGGCGDVIEMEETALCALGQAWHPRCFSCSMCANSIGEGGRFYEHDGGLLCVDCFTENVMTRCSACEQPISGATRAIGEEYWHPLCFKCSVCNELLADSVYRQKGSLFCRAHFLATFAKKCARCDEYVMGEARKLGDDVFHPHCVCCDECEVIFTEGQGVFSHEEKLLCEEHYLERTAHTCFKCGDKIIGENAVGVNNQVFHGRCVACFMCEASLTAGGKVCILNEELYCETCAKRLHIDRRKVRVPTGADGGALAPPPGSSTAGSIAPSGGGPTLPPPPPDNGERRSVLGNRPTDGERSESPLDDDASFLDELQRAKRQAMEREASMKEKPETTGDAALTAVAGAGAADDADAQGSGSAETKTMEAPTAAAVEAEGGSGTAGAATG